MDNLILFGTFALLLILRVPIGVSVGLAISAFLVFTGNQPLTYLATNMFGAMDSFPLMAIPFFILGGALMEGGGLSKRLVNLGVSVVGHLDGGLAIVTVMCCMFFGAISGSSPATVAAIGTIMVPAMVKQGYDKSFAVALVTVSGCLGVIVPPSIPMVLYGISTGTSIGTLFMGGFGPALLIGLSLCTFCVIVAKKRGYHGSNEPFSMRKVIKAFGDAVWALLVPVIILGGIYGGYFTPTEAAVISCVYGALAGVFIYRELTWAKFLAALESTCVTCGSCLIMVGTGTVLGRILALQRIPDAIVNGMTSLTDNRIIILLLINLILLVVGCIMDTTPAILILSPILYPVAAAFGVSAVHFGLIMIVNMSIGFITPPVGCNLFVASGLTNTKFTTLCRAIVPYILLMFTCLLVITYAPFVVEGIPKLLGMM